MHLLFYSLNFESWDYIFYTKVTDSHPRGGAAQVFTSPGATPLRLFPLGWRTRLQVNQEEVPLAPLHGSPSQRSRLRPLHLEDTDR